MAIAACHPGETARSTTSFPGAAADPPGATAQAAAPTDPRDAAAADADPGSADAPQTAPILDKARGNRAAKDYQVFLRRLCNSLAESGAGGPELLESVGLGSLNPVGLCVNEAPEAIASGSFFERGADEVLLDVYSDSDAASGERTLALMRRKGSHYGFVRHLLASAGFKAHLRLLVPGGLDLLMLCSFHGNMGLYPSECGFLGQEYFGGNDRNDKDDGGSSESEANRIQLVDVSVCGPQEWVELGNVTLQGRRISVVLVVVNSVRVPDGHDDGYTCNKEANRHEKRFTITFAIVPSGGDHYGTDRVRRLTPIPREVTRVLELY